LPVGSHSACEQRTERGVFREHIIAGSYTQQPAQQLRHECGLVHGGGGVLATLWVRFKHRTGASTAKVSDEILDPLEGWSTIVKYKSSRVATATEAHGLQAHKAFQQPSWKTEIARRQRTSVRRRCRSTCKGRTLRACRSHPPRRTSHLYAARFSTKQHSTCIGWGEEAGSKDHGTLAVN
jgi:hypothetical protein